MTRDIHDRQFVQAVADSVAARLERDCRVSCAVNFETRETDNGAGALVIEHTGRVTISFTFEEAENAP